MKKKTEEKLEKIVMKTKNSEKRFGKCYKKVVNCSNEQQFIKIYIFSLKRIQWPRMLKLSHSFNLL